MDLDDWLDAADGLDAVFGWLFGTRVGRWVLLLLVCAAAAVGVWWLTQR